MRERFSTQEWETVKQLPFVAFHKVACADGQLQNEEATRFIEELKRTAFCENPLRRALSQEILSSDFMSLFACTQDQRAWDTQLEAARDILRAKLSEEEYKSFAGDLVLFAVDVALAAGEKGADAKSPEEEAALIDLARRLDLSTDDLGRSLRNPGC